MRLLEVGQALGDGVELSEEERVLGNKSVLSGWGISRSRWVRRDGGGGGAPGRTERGGNDRWCHAGSGKERGGENRKSREGKGLRHGRNTGDA